MKIYGSDICKDCREFKALATERNLAVGFVDITENVANLRAFLHLRDTSPLFDGIRAEGRIGIPVFENENGEITLDANIALAWLGEAPMEKKDALCESCG